MLGVALKGASRTVAIKLPREICSVELQLQLTRAMDENKIIGSVLITFKYVVLLKV
jgi:hypothetical protein